MHQFHTERRTIWWVCADGGSKFLSDVSLLLVCEQTSVSFNLMCAWYLNLLAVNFVRDKAVKHVWLVERVGSLVYIVNERVRGMLEDRV